MITQLQPKGKGDKVFPKDFAEAVSRVTTYKPIVELDHYRLRISWEKQVDLLPPRCLPRLPRRVVPNGNEGSEWQIACLKS
jgi:hypothetical protein